MANIRKKVAKAKSRSEATASKTSNLSSSLSIQQNPFLHASKITKKDKRNDKKTSFLNQLSHLSNSAISKSTRKRLNRKARSNLSTNLTGLLDSISQNVDSNDQIDGKTGYIPPKIKPINPKNNSKSNEKVIRHETQRFKEVVSGLDYQKNPFDALKNQIAQNLQANKI